MNIQPVNSELIPVLTKPKAPSAKAAPATTADDVFKPEQNQKLMEALHNEPDVRPEAVARGRTLAADPSYPSNEVLAKLAQRFLSERLGE